MTVIEDSLLEPNIRRICRSEYENIHKFASNVKVGNATSATH